MLEGHARTAGQSRGGCPQQTPTCTQHRHTIDTHESRMGRRVSVLPWPVCSDPTGCYESDFTPRQLQQQRPPKCYQNCKTLDTLPCGRLTYRQVGKQHLINASIVVLVLRCAARHHLLRKDHKPAPNMQVGWGLAGTKTLPLTDSTLAKAFLFYHCRV